MLVFGTAVPQGYRTDDDRDEEQGFEISMVKLGWSNSELCSGHLIRTDRDAIVGA